MRSLALLLVAVSCIASTAHASNSSSGSVSGILPLNNLMLFNHNGSRPNVPACATVSGRWAFDASTPAGQSKVAALLTAYSLGKKITVFGAGQCDLWGDTETVSYFVIDD